MLTKEQIKQIKEQLFKQIEAMPPEQGKELKKQIQAMNDQELEQFLVQNKLIAQSQQAQAQAQQGSECIFCQIAEEKIQSYKIDENRASIAVLEINPVSKGHVIVIPKKHVEVDKMPTQAFTLAKKISRKIKTALKPQEVHISPAVIMDHAVINVIPFYKDQKPDQERKKEEPKELQELQQILIAKKRKIKPKPKKQESKPKKLPKAPVRMP